MGNLCQGGDKLNRPENLENDHAQGDGGIGVDDIEIDGPLTKKEVNERIQSCKETVVHLKGIKITYSYVSQRGYYPDDLSKANQDSFCVQAPFNNDESMGLFAVFDGHGSKGHLCAQFARDAIQANLAQKLNEGESFETAYPTSFISANDQLHKSRIDDSMSGTTAIAAMFNDGILEVANCGDSRAIIATEETVSGKSGKTKLVVHPLSIDQTPFRKDERERVKKCGARVMTMDQLDGLEPIHENWGLNLGEEIDDSGDPPRIWAQDGDYPGTAFTRSIGDAVSERLGVFADPEMSQHVLAPEDKFMVVASDGVFEFITSQSVVEMVQQHNDALEACKAVTTEAYQLWLQYEVRTDDITMILCYLDEIAASSSGRKASKVPSIANASESGMRPVRANPSRAKRRIISRTVDETDEEEYIVADHLVPKSTEEEARIDAAVKTNFLFQHLTQQQRQEVFSVMKKVTTTTGQYVIRQGDSGNEFYVVDSGTYDVKVAAAGATPESGETVHNYSSGGHFGELALMYAKPRAASVVATTNGLLWSLDRAAFRAILMRSPASTLKKTLRKVDVLKGLSQTQVERLIEIMSEVSFKDGETIIKQGDVGDIFYIITDGAGVCTIKEGDGEKEVLQLKQYDYFGERALLNDAPRAASVRAIGSTKCLHIGRKAFEDVLGPLQKILDQDRRRREKAAISIGSSNVATVFTPVADNANGDGNGNGDYDGELSALHHAETAAVDEHVQYSIVSVNGNNNGEFGLKTFGKGAVMEANLTNAVANERWLWSTLAQPQPESVIPRLVSTCVELKCLHMLLSNPIGGDFSAVQEKLFAKGVPMEEKEKAARFYVGCAAAALAFLHTGADNNLYRALAPELLLVSKQGYLALADFRMAKRLSTQQERTFTLCGTPEYMAPEQVNSSGHSLGADLWSLGVFLYELLAGEVPFGAPVNGQQKSDLQIYNEISAHQPGLLAYPADFSAPVKKLLDGLLSPSDTERPTAVTVQKEAFFSGFDWKKIGDGSMQAPQKPTMTPVNSATLNLDGNLVKDFEGDTSWYDGF